ncbi:MAG TPA: 4-alpha-glucanotransferase [Verrucomicrobiae bacterium]|nr:4-alpha-glucanotransferase [Verrucomicrobiae bacterium]
MRYNREIDNTQRDPSPPALSPSEEAEGERENSRQSLILKAICNRALPCPALRQLARGYGIHLSYIDMAGARHHSSPEALKAILELLGAPADTEDDVRDSLHLLQQRQSRQCLPEVIVAWDARRTTVPVRLSDGLDGRRAECKLVLEDGRCKKLHPHSSRSPQTRTDGQTEKAAAQSLVLPSLPLGYHRLELEVRGRHHQTLVICAPEKAFPGRLTRKIWGAFVPMYAVHSSQSWGAGNLADWTKLMEWTASVGANVLGTLPLLAAFLGPELCEPSPYSPASRLFWNEFYVDIQQVPEFSASPAAQKLFRSRPFQQRLHSFRQSPWIDYRAEMESRRQALKRMAEFFFHRDSKRRGHFQSFLKTRPRLEEYAQFQAATEQTGKPWTRWEGRMRYGRLQPGDYSESARQYHLYAQWVADCQIAAFNQRCRQRDIQTYLDLPLGVHTAGYDLWRERDSFAFPAAAGAPPDLYFTQGQNWGFAPLHPQRIRQRHFGYVIEYLRFQLRCARVLRIDHVMGLHRLYWIPPGFPASLGAYVSNPAEELLAILCLESHRHQALLVGENLGTVPPEVNSAMARHQLRETYVLQYEQRPNAAHPLRPPPPFSLCSINTHDMPPFAAHWRGLDIADRFELGLIPRRKLSTEYKTRTRMNAALAKFLERAGLLKTGSKDGAAVLRAALRWLAASEAEALLVNLEDLWGEERPQNVPGTSIELPNWRRKTKLSLEEILTNPSIRDLLRSLARKRTH